MKKARSKPRSASSTLTSTGRSMSAGRGVQARVADAGLVQQVVLVGVDLALLDRAAGSGCRTWARGSGARWRRSRCPGTPRTSDAARTPRGARAAGPALLLGQLPEALQHHGLVHAAQAVAHGEVVAVGAVAAVLGHDQVAEALGARAAAHLQGRVAAEDGDGEAVGVQIRQGGGEPGGLFHGALLPAGVGGGRRATANTAAPAAGLF